MSAPKSTPARSASVPAQAQSLFALASAALAWLEAVEDDQRHVRVQVYNGPPDRGVVSPAALLNDAVCFTRPRGAPAEVLRRAQALVQLGINGEDPLPFLPDLAQVTVVCLAYPDEANLGAWWGSAEALKRWLLTHGGRLLLALDPEALLRRAGKIPGRPVSGEGTLPPVLYEPEQGNVIAGEWLNRRPEGRVVVRFYDGSHLPWRDGKVYGWGASGPQVGEVAWEWREKEMGWWTNMRLDHLALHGCGPGTPFHGKVSPGKRIAMLLGDSGRENEEPEVLATVGVEIPEVAHAKPYATETEDDTVRKTTWWPSRLLGFLEARGKSRGNDFHHLVREVVLQWAYRNGFDDGSEEARQTRNAPAPPDRLTLCAALDSLEAALGEGMKGLRQALRLESQATATAQEPA